MDERKGVLWVQMNGMDKPEAIGIGVAKVVGSRLLLFDDDNQVIGDFGRSDVQGWYLQPLTPPTGEWLPTE